MSERKIVYTNLMVKLMKILILLTTTKYYILKLLMIFSKTVKKRSLKDYIVRELYVLPIPLWNLKSKDIKVTIYNIEVSD